MPNITQNNKRIAKNSLFMSIRMVVVLLLSLYTTRIVLRVLGVVDFGVYNVVCGFVTMFAFLNTSMSNGIQRFINFEYGKVGETGINKVYSTSLYIQALLAVIVLIAVETFGLWYLHHKMVIPVERLIAAEWIFQFAIISFVLGIMQAPFAAIVTAHERFDFIAIVSIMDAFFRLAIAFIIKNTSYDKLIFYGILCMLISIVDISLYIGYVKTRFKKIQFTRGFDKTRFKDILGFSGWNLFGTCSAVVENQGIDLVLNFFFGPTINAAKGIATQINGAIQSFVSNITNPARPQIVQTYASNNISRSINIALSISKISGACIILLAVPIILEMDFILALWLGSNVPDHTSSFATLIIITAFFNTLQSSMSAIVHATGNMKKYQLSCSSLRVMSIFLSIIFLQVFNEPEMALLIVSIISFAVLLLSVFIVKQLVGLSFKFYLQKVLFPLIFIASYTLIILLSLHWIIHNEIVRVLLVAVLNTIIIGLSSFYFLFDSNERIFVTHMIKSFIQKFK